MPKYKRKPLTLEGFRFGADYYPDWFMDGIKKGDVVVHEMLTTPRYGKMAATINTMEGKMNAAEGDYIMRGVQGEMYPVKQETFDSLYDIVEEAHPITPAPETNLKEGSNFDPSETMLRPLIVASLVTMAEIGTENTGHECTLAEERLQDAIEFHKRKRALDEALAEGDKDR